MKEGAPTSTWSAGALSGDPIAVMRGFQDGIPVRSVATSRDALRTCRPYDDLPDIVERNRADQFDHMPIVEDGRITGLIELVPFMRGAPAQGVVGDHGVPLSEHNLIGADASILAFVRDADRYRCRLVVSGNQISGMVCLSDIQKLPVRASLFGIVTALEMVMTDAIRREFEGSVGWIARLSDDRQEKLRFEMEKARKDDAFVDGLLFTQFADKAMILKKSPLSTWSKKTFHSQMYRAQSLRDALAHARDYAADRTLAAGVCETVRQIDAWIAILSDWPGASGSGIKGGND